jgi:hypothetical protein
MAQCTYRSLDGIAAYQNANFGIFWKALVWKILAPLVTIYVVYVFYGHLVYLSQFRFVELRIIFTL